MEEKGNHVANQLYNFNVTRLKTCWLCVSMFQPWIPWMWFFQLQSKSGEMPTEQTQKRFSLSKLDSPCRLVLLYFRVLSQWLNSSAQNAHVDPIECMCSSVRWVFSTCINVLPSYPIISLLHCLWKSFVILRISQFNSDSLFAKWFLTFILPLMHLHVQFITVHYSLFQIHE